MYQKLIDADFEEIIYTNETSLYHTLYKGMNTYIISHPDTRNLLCHQELIGNELPHAFASATNDFLGIISKKVPINNTNILYILRGGLNFPLEKSCSDNMITNSAISFLSSERFWDDNKISKIETKYKKIICVDEATLLIGDIVASGKTIYNAIEAVVEAYNKNKVKLKKIIVFTVGTYNALETLYSLNVKLRNQWKQFEGIVTVFYEGIFNVYRNKGVSNLNIPFVDFVCCDGFIAPEYRKELINNGNSIYEKCIIYDGGARRFEKQNHISEILNYWRKLLSYSSHINVKEFVEEKLGINASTTYSEWMSGNYYKRISSCEELYKEEMDFYLKQTNLSLSLICQSRIKQIKEYYNTI